MKTRFKEFDNASIAAFLKFGQEEHLIQLREKGTLYMNPLDYFKKLEDGELRGDSFEGVSSIRNIPGGSFAIPEINFEGKFEHLRYMESPKELYGNIFSLYCISSVGFEHPEDISFDERLSKFGSHFLIVMNSPSFIKRITKALSLLKNKYYFDFIKYYDKEKANRKISVFEKPNEFAYQKEYRFYVARNEITPLVINIGSIEDISEIVSIEDLYKPDFIQLRPKV